MTRSAISSGIIPRKRLGSIPLELRFAHEFCYFLHDESARLLVEYEGERAHIVRTRFKRKSDSARVANLAAETDAVTAMRALGYEKDARRVVLNTITMGMVSDALHHIYEALSCLERRKSVVALNLLRKPLTDSLVYLTWMLADEDEFYAVFSAGDPTALAAKAIGNRRPALINQALARTAVARIVTAEEVVSALFDAKNEHGLQGAFQHAVHLVTVQRPELRTAEQNFNSIFRAPMDDQVYWTIYAELPTLMLYFAHVVLELFDRMRAGTPGAKRAFELRARMAYGLVCGGDLAEGMIDDLKAGLAPLIGCECGAPLKVTASNAAQLVMAESFRCTRCRGVVAFPFSWLF